jgi:putative addiction module antidote
MYPLKLRNVGTSTGITLPKELLGKLRVGAGDTIFFTEAPDGTFRLTPYNPAFAAQIEAAERILREDRNLLHAAAK